MDIAQLVQNLHSRGARLRVEQDKLKITAPELALDTSTLAAVRQHKQAIIDFLLTDLALVEHTAASTHPLSFNQKALWSLYRLAPANPAFNLLFACQLPQDVNLKVLHSACQLLLDRHELLRARFRDTATGPVCDIQPALRLHIDTEQTEQLTETQISERLGRFGDAAFVLEQGAIRFLMLHNRCGESVQHYLAFTLHHIVAEFWSCQLLLAELSVLYHSIVQRKNTRLPAIRMHYYDYTRWQQDYLASPASETDLQYWQSTLGGNLPVLDLPRDRPRPALMSFRGDVWRQPLDAELSQRVRRFAQDNNVTASTLMLAAYFALLQRCSRQHDILVGTPAANRNISGSEWMVGDFSNPVVVRCQVDADAPFTRLLNQVHSGLVNAIRHQDYPFPLLVEKLRPQRDTSFSPICQAMFLWHKPNQQRLGEIIGLHDSVLTNILPVSGQRGATYDLMLSVADMPDGLICSWAYSTDLFDASTVQRLARQLVCLLGDALNDAQNESDANAHSKPLGQLQLLDQASRQQLLENWNQTRQPFDFNQHLLARIEQQAHRHPQTIAISSDSESLDYATLMQRVDTLARQLGKRAIGAGDLVAIALPRNATMIVAMLAVLKRRAAYVPVDPEYPPARIAYMIEHSRAATVITCDDIRQRLALPPEQVLCLDGQPDAAQLAAESTAENTTRATVENPTNIRAEQDAPHPDDLAYVIYTSGSTGVPKGVRIQQRALLNLLLHFHQQLNLQPGQRWLAVTSISFDIAGLEIFLPLLGGATIVLADRHQAMDGNWLARRLHQNDIDFMQATPASWQMLCGSQWQGNASLTALCGGEALSAALASALLAKVGSLYNVYGPTETTIWSLIHRVTAAQQAPAPIGRPLANTSLYVLDAAMQPCAIGVPGELHIGGTGVSPGYLYREDLTAERFIPNPFSSDPDHRTLYRTGDLVRYLADGSIDYIGRLDHQVKVRGFRIELAEVEAALLLHDSVKDAVAVVRTPQGQDAAILVAYILTNAPDTDIRALKRALSLQLPQYMIPGHIQVLTEFPLTPNGKVDRNALPEPDVRQNAAVHYVPARDLIEHRLVQIWESVLGVQPVSVNDNFFDLGGHSLLAMQLMVQVQQAFNRAPPLSILFQAPTVETFANILRLDAGASNRSSNPVLCIKPGAADAVPLILVHPVGGSVFCYHELANLLQPHQPVYGLQLPMDDQGNPMIGDVSEMGARYATAVCEQFGDRPVALGGWSLGGIIAFDIALRLEQQQLTPQHLFIIDSAAPDMKEQIDELHDVAVLVILAKELGLKVEQINLGFLVGASLDEGLGYILQLCIEHGILPDTFRVDDLRDRFQLVKSNQAAQKTYVCPVQPYHGRTTILRAEGQPASRPDKLFLGWRHHAIDCQALEIAGDHFTLIRPPFVQSLATRLTCLLQPDAASATTQLSGETQ